MSRGAGAQSQPRLAAWCGWMLAGAAALIPLLAWLGPLGFAPLTALLGLLCLPALHVRRDDLPTLVPLAGLLLWALASTAWSPYTPTEFEEWTAAKLVLQLPLYWAAVCAARRAAPGGRTWALRIFAWGMGALAAVLVVEAATGAALYQALKAAVGDPIRPDLARRNVAQGAFVLALFWAPAALAGLRTGAPRGLVLLLAAGVAAPALTFGSDAPLIALALGAVVSFATIRWPNGAPRVLAGIAALFFLAAPWVIWMLRDAGVYAPLRAAVSESWAARMGYWDYAVNWTTAHPWRGWGLDASREFGPGITLHPHNGALQVWLELGAVGAVIAALFWAMMLLRIGRPKPGLTGVAAAAAAVSYLTFAAVSFGVWQEWWLALGALILTICAALRRQPAAVASPVRGARPARRSSTIAPVSE